MTNIDRTIAEAARAWPFEEARKIVARIGGKVPAKGYVLFETGYGPSGLPHIGTFGEVVRTTMVRQACPTTCRTRRCWRPISASR
jgi:lysyl-tRNA synthetase class 1